MKKKINVLDPSNEVPTEVLAQSIVDISEGMKKLRGGKLNNRALLVLLRDATGVGMSEIEKVLDGVENLEARYVRKKV